MPTVSSESWLAPGATGPVGSPGSGPPGLGSACKVGAPRLLFAGGSGAALRSGLGGGYDRCWIRQPEGGRDDEGAAKWGRDSSSQTTSEVEAWDRGLYDRLGPAAEGDPGHRGRTERSRARGRCGSRAPLGGEPDRLEVSQRSHRRAFSQFQIPAHDGAGEIEAVGSGVREPRPVSESGSGSGWRPREAGGGQPRNGRWSPRARRWDCQSSASFKLGNPPRGPGPTPHRSLHAGAGCRRCRGSGGRGWTGG